MLSCPTLWWPKGLVNSGAQVVAGLSSDLGYSAATEHLDVVRIQSLLHPKPEYVFRPSQIIRRLFREYASTKEYEEVMLPWGMPIKIRPSEGIGSWIWRLGLLELPVSEAIYRLADPGEWAVDVGANIGHMTSIMAIRVGPLGRVLSFEPHPLTYGELSANVRLWGRRSGIGEIRAYRIALSDRTGDGFLDVPGEDSVNRGLASVALNRDPVGSKYAIQLRPLTEFVAENDRIGVMKVDVEGHEYRVLKGAEAILKRQGIRDIIFEEYRPYPTETTIFLEEAGYIVFAVKLSFWGLELHAGSVRPPSRSDYIPTYLATSDPDRAFRRLGKRGWVVLSDASRQRIQEPK